MKTELSETDLESVAGGKKPKPDGGTAQNTQAGCSASGCGSGGCGQAAGKCR